MNEPLQVSLQWTEHEVGGITTAEAIVSLGPPQAIPDGPSTLLYLDIEQDEDESDDHDIETPGYVWRYGVGEEESGFGEAEYENGRALTLEQAKDECWELWRFSYEERVTAMMRSSTLFK